MYSVVGWIVPPVMSLSFVHSSVWRPGHVCRPGVFDRIGVTAILMATSFFLSKTEMIKPAAAHNVDEQGSAQAS